MAALGTVTLRRLALRHPAWSVVLVALTVRLVVVIGSHLLHLWPLIPDEGGYVDLAILATDGRVDEYCCGGYGSALYESTRLFIWQIHGLVSLFGPLRWLLQMPAVLYGVAAAFLVLRIVGRYATERWALFAGLVMALTPSAVLHSSVVLRESLIWLLVVIVARLIIDWSDASDVRRLVGLAASLLGVLVGLGWLRDQTGIVVAWSLLPVALLLRGQRRVRLVLLMVVLVTGPWLTGSGPAGLTVVENSLPKLGTVRAWMSLESNSAHVGFDRADWDLACGDAMAVTGSAGSATSGSSGAGAVAIAGRETMRVEVSGQSYDVVCSGQSALLVDNSALANLKKAPGGIIAFFLRPFPWEWNGDRSLQFRAASMENLLWLVGYVLALFGLRPLWRMQPALLVFIASYCSLIGIVASLTQGNLGTAFRHRLQILWAVALLGSIGGEHILGRLQARRAPPDSPT